MAIPDKSKDELVTLTRQILAGKLASSIMHKAKNILMPITGYVELIEGGCSLDKQKGYFKKIQNSGQGLQEFLKSFLRFSRSFQERVEEEIELFALIEEIISLFEYYINIAKVSLRKNVSPGKVKVRGVYDELSLILASVLLNAVEASSRGGSIRLVAEGVNITIDDDGPGITEEIKHRIFDPFFTTKKHSLGLGLSTSLFLAKGMSGDLILKDKNRFVISLCEIV